MSIWGYFGWIDSLSRDAHKCSKRCLDSSKEGILGIALWEVSRITQTALHCPCPESSSLIFTKWVVSIILLLIGLKILSMRVTLDLLHELTNTKIFGLFHKCMWQSRHPEIDVHNGSPRSISICIYVFVCVLVFLWTFNKQIVILAIKRETCIDFLSTRTGRLFCHNGSPRSKIWFRVWLGWLVVFCLSSNFWTQFLHPIISQGNLRRRSRWFIYFFV